MMESRRGITIAAFLSLAGLAAAQVSTVAVTTDDAETEGSRPTDANVGVDADDAVLVISNMRLSLFDKAGVLQNDAQVAQSSFPIVKTDASWGRLFDPRADYDPINDRLWYFYTEDNRRDPSSGATGNIARIHIGVSRQGVSPDALDSTDWHLFTSDQSPLPSGVAGTALDLTSMDLLAYRPGFSPQVELKTLYDLPSLAFDERAMIMSGFTGDTLEAKLTHAFVIIPYTHDSTESILDGDRPDENDITVIWLNDPTLAPSGAQADQSFQNYAVQEPHDQAVNASFYIGLNPTTGGTNTDLWLRGLYYDTSSTPNQWVLQQHRETASPFPMDGMDLPSSAFYFHESSAGVKPLTPQSTWGPSGTVEGPNAFAGFFSSAVLAKSGANVWRIFAVHTVRPDVSGSPGDQWAVQWYVINPKIGDLQTTTVGGWQPEIVEAGRIGGGQADGDYYHPTIVVTQQGVAYIEYTYSDDETWPEVRRVLLNSSYDAIVPNSEVTLRTGPASAYVGPAWADYADAQVDPEDPCSFWSVHTLVRDLPDPTQDPVSIDERDVWLFEPGFACNNANLNGDLVVDLYDMALFNSYYSTGARRVDMNTDGTTDATDAALYNAAYDAATSP